MSTNECTIRWRNKPIDKLSSEEMRRALVEALDHTLQPARAEPQPSAQGFYSAFMTGMFAGGICCFVAVALVYGLG